MKSNHVYFQIMFCQKFISHLKVYLLCILFRNKYFLFSFGSEGGQSRSNSLANAKGHGGQSRSNSFANAGGLPGDSTDEER